MLRLVYAVVGSILGGVAGYAVWALLVGVGLIGSAPDVEGLHHVILALFILPVLGLVLGAVGGLAVERYDRVRREQNDPPK